MFQQVVGKMYDRKIYLQEFVMSCASLLISGTSIQVGNEFLQPLIGSCGSNKV